MRTALLPLALVCALLVPRLARADLHVSFKDDALVPHALFQGALLVEAGDLLNLTQGQLAVEEDLLFNGAEDIDGVHVLADGRVLLTTVTAAPIDGEIYAAGDVILYDPGNGSVSKFFDVASFDNAVNVDAVCLFEYGPNAGEIVLSTDANATLAGVSFRPGDLVRYHLLQQRAVLIFSQDLITGTAFQKDIDALHLLANGHLILSVLLDGGTLGGLTLHSEDLVDYDPQTDTAVVYLDGTGLWNGTTARLNAASVTEPLPLAAPALPGLGLAGLAAGLLLVALRPRRRAR